MKSSKPVLFGVVFSTFFVGFGGGVVFPILPNLGAVLGIPPILVGLIISANRFARILANVPAGSLVDRIGTRKPFIAGLFVESIATLGYVGAIGSQFPEAWFLGARVLWGIGSAVVFASAYTIAADVSDGRSRGTSMGIVRGGITLGIPAGLILGGVVSDSFSVVTAFLVAASLAFFASLIAYRFVPETHVMESRNTVKPWELDISEATLIIGAVNFGIFFIYVGELFASLVLFIDYKKFSIFGYGPQGMSGLLMAITVVAAFIFMLAGGKASDIYRSRTPVLVRFLFISFLGFSILATADSLSVLVIACFLIGVGQGGTSGPLMALLADLTPGDQIGRAIGTNNILRDLGGGLGPVVILPLIETVGFSLIYALSALVPLFAGLVLIVGIRIHTGTVVPAKS